MHVSLGDIFKYLFFKYNFKLIILFSIILFNERGLILIYLFLYFILLKYNLFVITVRSNFKDNKNKKLFFSYDYTPIQNYQYQQLIHY